MSQKVPISAKPSNQQQALRLEDDLPSNERQTKLNLIAQQQLQQLQHVKEELIRSGFLRTLAWLLLHRNPLVRAVAMEVM
jgi:hypothetical protein